MINHDFILGTFHSNTSCRQPVNPKGSTPPPPPPPGDASTTAREARDGFFGAEATKKHTSWGFTRGMVGPRIAGHWVFCVFSFKLIKYGLTMVQG